MDTFDQATADMFEHPGRLRDTVAEIHLAMAHLYVCWPLFSDALLDAYDEQSAHDYRAESINYLTDSAT